MGIFQSLFPGKIRKNSSNVLETCQEYINGHVCVCVFFLPVIKNVNFDKHFLSSHGKITRSS